MQDFYDQLKTMSLAPLWENLHDLVPPEPRSPAQPHIWRYTETKPKVMLAGDLISAEEAERRVLVLENPGLAGTSAITRSLYAGIQLVLPGEIARCHRHAQSALRFVLEGSQAFTAVNGEKVMMAPFDLVLTPSGLWHDHGNDTDQPIIWLDGLDIPLLQTLDCGYAETYSQDSFPSTRAPGDTKRRYGANLRPVNLTEHDLALRDQPLFHYPFAQWSASLQTMAEDQTNAVDPHDGYKMEFINPVTGCSAMKTISSFCQLLPSGFESRCKQSTDGTIYTVCAGEGEISIGGNTFSVSPKDTFVVPSWQAMTITAGNDLILFSFSDKAVQERLGLWREKRH